LRFLSLLSMEEQPKLENEPEIIERAKKDDNAFEILYNHYFPRIYGYIFKRTGNQQVCEDITSTTFMKAFCNLKKYQHQGYSFGAWLYKIATNNLIDYYRKTSKKQEVNIDKIQNLEDESPSPEEFAQISQNRQLVGLALKKLSEKNQEILYLKFFAEMSNNEIAEILKISSNNTRVLIYRALKHFQKIYEERQK